MGPPWVPDDGPGGLACQKCGWLCTVRKVDKQLLDADAFIGVLCAECYAQTQDEEFGMK